jgi:hypothetical protein
VLKVEYDKASAFLEVACVHDAIGRQVELGERAENLQVLHVGYV